MLPKLKLYFEPLPENRRLNEEEKKTALNLLQLRCNKRFLQDKLAADYNKMVSQKDLKNLASTLKNADDDKPSKMVSLLENVYGANVSILHEDKQFKGLYSSTKKMRSAMNSWLEIVFIDGTCKLFKRNFTLMILLVEDSDGGSRIAGVGILASEERLTLTWFIECFAKENQEACSRMRCIIGDKDLTERDVIRKLFPGIPMYICIFHTLRTFSREVSTNKMNITIREPNESLILLNRMTKSTSEGTYDEIYQEFCHKVAQPVLNYFNKNWHKIRKEWTKYNITEGNLGNSTNNRLESINSKIKQIVKRNSTMTAFVKDFFKWLTNRDREMSDLLKRVVILYEEGTAEQQYKQFLTKYSFSMVLKELQTRFAITIIKMSSDTKECLIRSQNLVPRVTDLNCECSTWKSFSLPCRHIFAVREYFCLNLFAEELCRERWTADYDMPANNMLQRTPQRPSGGIPFRSHVINTISTPKNLTTFRKRKLLMVTMNDMIQVASQYSDAKFHNKLNVLKEIQCLWRQGHDICITRAFSCPDDDKTSKRLNDESDAAINKIRNSIHHTHMHNTNAESTLLSDLSTEIAEMSINQKDQITLAESADSPIDRTTSVNRIHLKAPIKISGRPKAATQTTVVLPRKSNRTINFKDRASEVKAKTILGWLIRKEIMDNVLLGEYKIGKPGIEHLKPETLTDSVVDDAVDLSIVEPYFEKRVFCMLKKIVSRKRKSDTLTRGTCRGLVEDSCILCNGYLLWHHFGCAKLKRTPNVSS